MDKLTQSAIDTMAKKYAEKVINQYLSGVTYEQMRYDFGYTAPHKDEMYKRTNSSYRSMISRCYFKSNISYENYGEKGIKVCDLWRTPDLGFWYFVMDMGIRPDKRTLDRINNSMGYHPDNCRWSDIFVQNRDKNMFITINSETKTLNEWAKISGLSKYTIRSRLRLYGFTGEKLLRPVKHKEQTCMVGEEV